MQAAHFRAACFYLISSMKRLFSVLVLSVLLAIPAAAQQPLYLFPEFTNGSISFRGFDRSEKLPMNIDAVGQRILYYKGGQLMELTNTNMMESLVLGGRTFVMKEGMLCERLAWEADTVYVNWKLKKVNTGSVGALGAATQNKVDVLWTNLDAGTPVDGEGRYYQMGEHVTEIWERKADNTYFFSVDGQEYKVRRLKDLYKAFPDQAPALKAYAKEKKYTMENAQDALRVIGKLKELVKE